MKKIWKYLVAFFKEEIKPLYFLSVAALVAVSVYLEYTYDLSLHKVDSNYGDTGKYFLANFIMYGIPFIGTYVLYIFFYKRYDLLTNIRFWGLIIFALAVYSFRSSWFDYRDMVGRWSEPENYRFNVKCSNQIFQGLLIFIPATLYWFFYQRREMPIYGFKVRGVDFRPYFTMLLCMVPLITWASFQKDFLDTYPVYSRLMAEPFATQESTLKVVFFELCYGFDFVMTEFYFRGFLILAFARFVGRGCIMPMVAFYVYIHFGKPAGETISSFFGGMILGVIAYETRSIIGGIIAHLGVAWLMETGGTIGRALDLAGTGPIQD